MRTIFLSLVALITALPSMADAMILRRAAPEQPSAVQTTNRRPTIDELRNASLARARVRLPRTRISRRTRQQQYIEQQTRRAQNVRTPVLPAPARPVSTPESRVDTPVFDAKMDTAVRSQHVLLGQVTPIVGGVRAFSNSEPIDVDEIEVEMVTSPSSVSQLLIYDESGRFLATASRVSGGFVAYLPDGLLQLPYRKELSVYARARLKTKDSGGTSGQSLQVDEVTVRGNGAWSTTDLASTSTETFVSFESARARITTIESVGSEGVLVGGTDQLIGAFRFTAEETDSAASAALEDLMFTIEQYGDVTVSNPKVRVEGLPEGYDCSASATAITCSNLPATYGTIDTTPLTLRVYGDVTVPGSSDSAFLRLTLNDAGSPSDSGDITWTDGSATFDWLGLDSPMVRGPALKR